MRESSRQEDGKTPGLHVSLAGRVSIEADGVLIDEERFPGRQGRLVFAYLVAESGRPVPRDELGEVLWGEHPPATWEKALTVIVSKLRGLLEECGLDGSSVLTSAFGCYRLDLPEDSVIDIGAARGLVEAAEAALGAGEPGEAKQHAARAVSVARMPFLPGEDGRWVEQKRREQSDLLARGLGCVADASLRSGDTAAAARSAEEEIALEPYREDGYRRLMEAHAAAGNRAEALRVYERCRRFLADELGAYPSPETESVYRELLEAPVAVAERTPTEEAEPAPPRPREQSANRWSVNRAHAALAIGVVLAAAITVTAVRVTSGQSAPLQTLSTDRCSPLYYEGRGGADLLIAADLPLQRGSLATTRPMAEAMRLLLERRGFKAGRFSVGLQVCDDATPDSVLFSVPKCAENARAFAENPSVIGVVGPFASGCAAVEIPILNRAAGGPLAIVSPTNTYAGLTRRNPETAPGEPNVYYPTGRRNFARIIAADDVQAAADAILARKLGVRRAYVLDDTGSYGVALAPQFIRTARMLGIAVVGRGSWDANATTYEAVAASIAKTGADGVFLSGAPGENGVALLTDLRARLGPAVHMIAPDGFDPNTAAVAGAAAEGLSMSRPGVPNERLGRTGRQFVSSFSKKVGAEPTGFALHAAQALEVLLDAISRSDGTRASVVENLFTTRISNGILGSFWITASGDTTLNSVTIYRIERGKVRTSAIVVPDDLLPTS